MKNNFVNIGVIVTIMAFCVGTLDTNAQEVPVSDTTNTSSNAQVIPQRPTNIAPIRAQVKMENSVSERKEIQMEKKEHLIQMRTDSGAGAKMDTMTEGRPGLKNIRADMPMIKREIKMGSSTEMFRRANAERMEVIKKMRKDAFDIRKDVLVKNLNITIENLINIETRISDRINKIEESGKDMAEAKEALRVADEKISVAKTAVAELESYVPATSTGASSNTTDSSSSEIDVEKPRQIGDAAIKSLREARDALKAVVRIIAENVNQ